MFKVNRRYIQKFHNSLPLLGHYEYFVVECEDNGFVYNEFGWMPESEYREWKQEIIEENFPHCE